MRLMRRVDGERKYRNVKGACSHVWRTRDLTFALSGTMCEVCERCGMLQVTATDEPGAPVALHQGASESLRHEGAALGSIA